jgi:glycosyltransferase involved in cell wall biosynthesis
MGPTEDGAKRLLMIAFHFPPMAMSSGIHRTLSFARHLSEAGWQPIILTAMPRAYETVSDTHRDAAIENIIVHRAFAVDTARHLAIRGHYPGALARPDRWASWWLGAVPAGLRLIHRYRPAAIWSTYPIATAHAIGATLARVSGLPWIADFRDPMAQEGYPSNPKTWQSFRRIEERAIRTSSYAVFVTAGAARMYATRYTDIPASRFKVIENGYDEDVFRVAEANSLDKTPLTPGAVTLVHSGIVYPSERDPRMLFEAVRNLDQKRAIDPTKLRLRFRGAHHEHLLQQLAAAAGIGRYIEIVPPIPYPEALAEMLRADGLFVMQASNCNDQVPAKLYEYARARRPVLGLTDPRGDTAATLRALGIDHIAPLDSAGAIERALTEFVAAVRAGTVRLPDRGAVERASRRGRAVQLLELLASPL